MPYPNGGEIYSIKGPLFDSTYAPEGSQCRVATCEEIFVVKRPTVPSAISRLSSSSRLPLVSPSRHSIIGATNAQTTPADHTDHTDHTDHNDYTELISIEV